MDMSMRMSGAQPSAPSQGVRVDPITILGSSLLAWWTADRVDLITLSGSAVTSWKDVKAGYDVVQGVSASRPLYSATSFNSAPGVTFDGTDDELTLGSQPFPSSADPGEIWSICQQSALIADAAVRFLVSYGGASSATRRAVGRSVVSSVNRARADVGDGASTPVSTGANVDLSSRHLIRSRVGATEFVLATDGQANAPVSSVPATGVTRFRIGANTAGTAASFWQGIVRDVLITGPLTAGQSTALEAWALPRRML